MTLTRNLFFLFTITIFALASVILDIFNYNPYQASVPIFVNFFVSFLIAFAGIVAFIIYFMKIKFAKDKKINSFFIPSIRQALLISVALTLLLVLKTLQILDWWVGGPMVVAVVLLELFFQTNSPLKKHKNGKENI